MAFHPNLAAQIAEACGLDPNKIADLTFTHSQGGAETLTVTLAWDGTKAELGRYTVTPIEATDPAAEAVP